ncbi:MAG: hypothetical protein HKN17_05125 [Rhodothermales bacterium]|nr:hypothetical protein [Rhodothermales bacterium]
MSDDFYIGYEPRQPSDLARFVSVSSALLLFVAVATAAVLSASQDEPAEARFEYGVSRTYDGVVRIDPYPRLDLSDGSTILLVSEFMHGANEAVLNYVGQHITVSGSLIERQRLRMLEIDAQSIVREDAGMPAAAMTAAGADAPTAPAAPAAPDERGAPEPVTVQGELLDGKCFLGVMKPGEGTVHRACARLCLRGGIPALIAFVEAGGRARTALVTFGSDVPLAEEYLRFVGRPVEATGSYDPAAAGGIGVFTVDPSTIRIL